MRGNDRYGNALAWVDGTAPLGMMAAAVRRPVTNKGKRCRASRLWLEEDPKLLELLRDRAFTVRGLWNRDVAGRHSRLAGQAPAQRAQIAPLLLPVRYAPAISRTRPASGSARCAGR